MTAAPEGTPWWGWLIGIILVVGFPAILMSLASIKKVSTEAREQVTNSHKTNFRDDHDAVKQLVNDVKDRTDAILEALARHDSEISGIRKDSLLTRTDIMHLREAVDGNAAESRRMHQALSQRLDDHIEPDH